MIHFVVGFIEKFAAKRTGSGLSFVFDALIFNSFGFTSGGLFVDSALGDDVIISLRLGCTSTTCNDKIKNQIIHFKLFLIQNEQATQGL